MQQAPSFALGLARLAVPPFDGVVPRLPRRCALTSQQPRRVLVRDLASDPSGFP
jgi:hypothetical protein